MLHTGKSEKTLKEKGGDLHAGLLGVFAELSTELINSLDEVFVHLLGVSFTAQ